jgi:hypothetical protein
VESCDGRPQRLNLPMVRIAISRKAFDAIVASLPSNVGFENKRAENGDVYVWLPPNVLAKLNALRGRGQSYSDVILRLAATSRG